MGSSLWEKLGLPLLIGVASPILVAALCFLSVRLWNCLMDLTKTRSAAGESAHDQPLPDSDACFFYANGVPDLEMGNGYGPAQDVQSTTEPELELGIVDSGQETEQFSDQETHTPLIKFAVTTSKAKVTGDAASGAASCPSPCACRNGRSSFPATGSC